MSPTPPPAQLHDLRSLIWTEHAPGDGIPPFVRAASAIRRWGNCWVVVQDDVNALALLEADGSLRPLLLPAGPGGLRQFSVPDGNKADKMDLEAAAVLPDGRLLVLGSGSTPTRDRWVLVHPDLSLQLFDASALYEKLRQEREFSGRELNLEGALVVAGELLLLQRGNGAGSAEDPALNALGRLELSAVIAWLAGSGPVPTLRAVESLNLGEIAGVPLGVTDATLLPDGRVVLLLSAEDSPDTFEDGEILGSRIALWDRGQLVVAEILGEDAKPTRLKLEGIEWAGELPGGESGFVVVADMDDPQLPSWMATLRWCVPRVDKS